MMYFLIAYKRDSSDYCRGCHMASYSSDFNTEYRLTRDELIAQLAGYLFKNKSMRINECEYGFLIQKDGIVVFDDLSNEGHINDTEYFYEQKYGLDTDAYWLHYEEMENLKVANSRDITEIMTAANKIADDKDAAEKLAAQKKEEAEKERKRLEHEAWKKKEYERLKAEFEGGAKN